MQLLSLFLLPCYLPASATLPASYSQRATLIEQQLKIHQESSAIGIAMSDSVVRSLVIGFRSTGDFRETLTVTSNPEGTTNVLFWFENRNGGPTQFVLAVVNESTRSVISITST